MNNVTYQIEIEMQYQEIMKKLVNTSMQYALEWIGMVIILILINFLYLGYMFKPLERLLSLSRNHSNQVGNNINRRIFKILN